MMKFDKKFLGIILAVAMMFSMFVVNVAAADETETSVVTINYVYKDANGEPALIFGAEGRLDIVIANPDKVSVTVDSFVSTGTLYVEPMHDEEEDRWSFMNSSRQSGTLSFKLQLTITGAKGEKVDLRFADYYVKLVGDIQSTKTPVDEENATIDTLEVVDYTELNVQLARYNEEKKVQDETSKYTASSWGAVETAARNANGKLNKSYKQSEVDAAATALENAIDALVVLNVNYEALSAKVTEAKALDPNDFVAVNWYEFRVALSNAESFLNRQNAQDQASIDNMLKTLTDAMAALKSIDEIYNAGFEAGKTAGNTAGYEAGFAAGKTEGYDSGKKDGYDAGKTEGYAAGKLAGIEEGKLSVDTEAYYKDGFDAGYDEGYEAGYAAGLAAGKAEDKEEGTTSDGESTDSKDDETTPVVDDGEEKSATIWIVLFIVFLVTTLGLAAYIVLTMVLKKKKESDNTPVVDYNIEDDADAE